jgi:acetyltransferase-like isoleucine patch superfamily enzyme
MNLAPIVLFVYNRPWHTEQTLSALEKNKLAPDSILYIYADGAKENASTEQLQKIQEVRNIIKQDWKFKEIHIIERAENWGLASNIENGVTKIVNEHGKIIVLEDDIVTSIGFLKFMNDALTLYQDEEKIMHINGYMFPSKVQENMGNTFFCQIAFSWSWATWDYNWKNYTTDSIDIWQKLRDKKLFSRLNMDDTYSFQTQLEENIKGKIKTWAVKWHAVMVLNNFLALTPKTTLVVNIGNDGTGDNCGIDDNYKNQDYQDYINLDNHLKIEESFEGRNIIKKYYYQLNKINHKKLHVWQNLKSKISAVISLYRFMKELYIRRDAYQCINRSFDEILEIKLRNRNCIIDSSNKFIYSDVSTIFLSENVYIGFYNVFFIIGENDEDSKSALIVGKNSYIGEQNNIRASGGKIIIGSNCLISQQVSIIAANHKIERGELIRDQEWINKGDIIIEDDVWIGCGSQIMSGVKIGKGAVIGAGSLVNSNIPPYTIYGGVPAKFIKNR